MKTFTILAAAGLAAAAAAPAVSAVPATVIPSYAQDQAGPQRGAVVRGAGGAELGRLEGRRTNDGVAEIIVRGPDGQMRAIPASAVMVHGEDLHATWSESQFQAAEVLVPVAAVGAPATGAGGNQGPGPESDATRLPTADPDRDELQDATRPTPVEQQQAPDARPLG